MKLPGKSVFPYISFVFKRIELYLMSGVESLESMNESVKYKVKTRVSERVIIL